MNPWFISGSLIAIILAAAGGYFQGSEHGKAQVQNAWDKEKAAQYAEYAKGQEAARKKEQELQANADQLRREKDVEIKNLNARAVALTNSLQQRQTRPSETGSLSSTTSTRPASCSGKELFREDGEFLVRVAREADELRSALKQCYTQYEALRK
jgi:hypothetical protein